MPWYDRYKQVADNASTNIPLPTGKSIVTDNSPYTQNQFLGLMEGMRSGVQYDKQQEQNRISQRKNAELAVDKNQPFTLPSGQTKKFSEMDFREKRYVEGTALENRGRFFPNEESIIDDLNPLNLISSMAGNMSKAPLEAQRSNSYIPYVTSVASPLAMGALAGIGAQNTGQFINNITNPLAGTGQLVDNLGNKYLPNAYKYNPLAFKPNPESYYRVLGKEGVNDALESGIIRANPKNIHPFSGEPIYDKPYFSKGVPFDRDWKSPFKNKKGKQTVGSIYPDETMVEVFGHNKFHATNDLVTSPINTLQSSDEAVNFYKRDWLKRYEKIDVPKQQFKSELGVASQKNSEYQDGGQIPLHNKSQWMKNEIVKNALYGNPAAWRMMSDSPKVGRTPEGIGTHYMTTYDNYAVPLLQDKGGDSLTYIKNPTPSREDFKFNTPEEADFFAEHYKEVAPMMKNWTDKYKK